METSVDTADVGEAQQSLSACIAQKHADLGGVGGPLGAPISAELTTTDGLARYQVYRSGAVYCHATEGAHEIHGPVHQLWASLGAHESGLGYPVSDVTQISTGEYCDFENGVVYLPSGGAARVLSPAFSAPSSLVVSAIDGAVKARLAQERKLYNVTDGAVSIEGYRYNPVSGIVEGRSYKVHYDMKARVPFRDARVGLDLWIDVEVWSGAVHGILRRWSSDVDSGPVRAKKIRKKLRAQLDPLVNQPWAGSDMKIPVANAFIVKVLQDGSGAVYAAD
ncbi:hypothetical protein WMF11_46125 [Sorangium sp. So ce295]|uniref:LGFP repeat-containing protein n=1 Tax=Sorangium sp. So ce295 TaxID=3133295 RepID=UPI003F612712